MGQRPSQASLTVRITVRPINKYKVPDPLEILTLRLHENPFKKVLTLKSVFRADQ